jgi:hypothetical protein
VQAEIDALHAQVEEGVERAFAQAAADPLPEEASAFDHMLA